MGKIEKIERACARIEISQSGNAQTAADTRQVLLKHEVLFFRGQRQTTNTEQGAPTVQEPDGRTSPLARVNLETDSGISQEIHDVM
jgi:hypothetical protein